METTKTDTRKQKAAYVTAIVAFIVGWGLTIAGFLVPPLGEVSGSVLAILGEAMVYTASVFGITLYFNHQMERFRIDAKRYIDRTENKEEQKPEEYED